MLKLTVLHNEYPSFVEETAGFCILIEIDQLRILFDTSMKKDVLINAQKSNISLDNIDYVVFSHGHYDHTDGLKYLDLHEIKNILAHPDCFKKRFCIYKGKEFYLGIPFHLEYLKRETNVIQSKESFWILDNKVVFLGEIPRTNSFESQKSMGYFENNEADWILDDSGLVIKSEKGLIIISGCSHAGICNIIEYAKKICNEERIHVVMGGMHLFDENLISPTINYLKKQNITNLFVAHCLSDLAFTEMENFGAKRIHTFDKFEF